MMTRRDWLRRAAILAAAGVAANDLDLMERLLPRRLMVPGADFASMSATEAMMLYDSSVISVQAGLNEQLAAMVRALANELDRCMLASHRGIILPLPPGRQGRVVPVKFTHQVVTLRTSTGGLIT